MNERAEQQHLEKHLAVQHLTESDIFEYLHSAGSSTQLSDFTEHLRTCAHCRARMEAEKSLEMLLIAQPLQWPSTNFTESVMTGVAASHVASGSSPKISGSKHGYLYWLIASLAVAFTALLLPSGEAHTAFGRSMHQVGAFLTSDSAQTLYLIALGIYILWAFDEVLRRIFHRTV